MIQCDPLIVCTQCIVLISLEHMPQFNSEFLVNEQNMGVVHKWRLGKLDFLKGFTFCHKNVNTHKYLVWSQQQI